MIYLFLVVAMIGVSFWAGMKTADRYHREAVQHEEYALRLQHARMYSGDYSAYVAPPQKRKISPIGQPFMDKLKTEGRATTKLNPKPELR